ncbi:hypothetical protein ACLOJK_024576 [Asimina triloba]
MDIGQIQHKFVDVGGLKLHIAEIGSEIWYSWRYQMLAVADAGFRAIAPDYRGYGLSEQPPEPEKASFEDLDKDLLEMMDCLGIDKLSQKMDHIPKLLRFRGSMGFVYFVRVTTTKLSINDLPERFFLVGKDFGARVAYMKSKEQGIVVIVFLVGKDFGARVAYLFAARHPESVSGVISLGVPFIVPGGSQVDLLPKGCYMSRWMEPGRAEADFGRFNVMTVVRNIYILFSGSELPIANDDQEIMDLVEPSTPLPAWFGMKDLQVYASLYAMSGFRFPLQVPYRSWMRESNIANPKVLAPSLLIVGEKDYSLKFTEDYIKSGKVKIYVPDLKTVFLAEGSHFVQEQFPGEVNKLTIEFLNKHM